ncbi:MAG: hypothetical protein U0R28_12785 [Candidatus Nanopelagicales bacterium]
MRFLMAVAVVAALAACSSTDQPEPLVSASTVVQEQVDNFCQDVQDALTRGGSQDPEDAAERLEELQETAQDLGVGVRDNLYAADALTKCEQELRDAINAG